VILGTGDNQGGGSTRNHARVAYGSEFNSQTLELKESDQYFPVYPAYASKFFDIFTNFQKKVTTGKLGVARGNRASGEPARGFPSPLRAG
jgi:hypothetical protein